MIIGATVTMLGLFDVFEALGWSGDKVAVLGATLLTIAAAVRTILEMRNAQRVKTEVATEVQSAYREGLAKPTPEVRKYQGREGGSLGPIIALVVMLLASSAVACDPGSGGSSPPSLGAVMSRVDVPRLLECGDHLPDYKEAAKCLGARALTQGLKIALDAAMSAATRAMGASGPAGAADVSEEEQAKIAADLDAELQRLAVEIDRTHAEQ